MKPSCQSVLIWIVGGVVMVSAVLMGAKFRLAQAGSGSSAVPPDIRWRLKIGGQRFSLYQYPKGSLSMMG